MGTQEAQSRLPGASEALGIPEVSETPHGASNGLKPHAAIREVKIPLKPMVWRRSGFNKKTGMHFTHSDCRKRMGEIGLLWAGRRLAKLPAGPVAMHVSFVFEHSDSHFNAAGHLKPEWIGTRPGQNLGDLDNLVKLVKDALTGIAYGDDSQVAELIASKVWGEAGESSHTLLMLWPL